MRNKSYPKARGKARDWSSASITHTLSLFLSLSLSLSPFFPGSDSGHTLSLVNVISSCTH